MIKELWRFFLKKYRKEDGIRRLYPQHVWWALAYTRDQYRWLRIERDPVRLAEWQRTHG